MVSRIKCFEKSIPFSGEKINWNVADSKIGE